jgi:hypothetical protein
MRTFHRLALTAVGLALVAQPIASRGTLGAAAPESAKQAAKPAAEAAAKQKAKPQTGPRYVDLAICLDTSNSMDGLIDSAKQKLWAIVNELSTAKPKPILRVALFQYGNDGLNSETGWVQKVSDLTDDLDTIYGKLFALRTNGGSELVARVVRASLNDLDWKEENRPLRIIVVAGNEPATQDTKYKIEDICKAAADKGIVVNTIFCGSETEGYQTGWADVARRTDGKYASIDADRGTVVVETPYDKPLAELSVELNKTYISYGKAGGEGKANQLAQDANSAASSAPAAAERAFSKASSLYRNARWDLVDAMQEKDFDLSKIAEADLPEEMRKLSLDERKAYIAERAKARADLQKKITDLNAKRDLAIKEERAKKGLDDKSAFDAALRGAVREQAEKQGFEFEKK